MSMSRVRLKLSMIQTHTKMRQTEDAIVLALPGCALKITCTAYLL